MAEQEDNYLEDDIRVKNMTDFFKSRSENVEAKPDVMKAKRTKVL